MLRWPGAGPSEAVTTHPAPEERREEIVARLDDTGLSKAWPHQRSPLPETPKIELKCPYCREKVGPTENTCPRCDKDLEVAMIGAQLAWLLRQRRRNLLLAFAFGSLFVVTTTVLFLSSDLGVTLEEEPFLGALGALVALISMCVALGCAVSYKLDNVLWGLLVLFNIPGVALLLLLPDQKGRRIARMRRFIANHPAAAREAPRTFP